MLLKNLLLLAVVTSVFGTESSKIIYMCSARALTNGIWIEDCVSWWEGWNYWDSRDSAWYKFKHGLEYGRKHYVLIAATKFEFEAFQGLEKQFKEEWSEEQKEVKKIEKEMFDANVEKVKNLNAQFNVFENFRDRELHFN